MTTHGDASGRLVCRHCGGENFHADVTVTGDAWVDSTGVFLNDKGEPHFEPSGSPQDAWNLDYDIDYIVCSDCDKKVPERCLGELVQVRPTTLKVGDRVTLPDGFDGTVEALGPDSPIKPVYGRQTPRLVPTVIVAGQQFFAHEVERVKPNSNQLGLLEAA